MKQKIFTILGVGFIALLVSGFLAGVALADSPGGGTGFTIPNPLNCDTLQDCVSKVIRGLLLLATPIVAVMVIWGGFQILTAGGDPEKFSTGKKTILYAAVGFAVILLAQGVVFIIQDVLGGGTCEGGLCGDAGCAGDPPAGPCPDSSSIQCINGAWGCP